MICGLKKQNKKKLLAEAWKWTGNCELEKWKFATLATIHTKQDRCSDHYTTWTAYIHCTMALRICWLNMDTFIVIDIFQKSDVNCKKRTMTISRATAKYTVLSSAKKQSSGKKGVFFLTFVLNVLTSRIFSLWKEKQSPEKLCGSDRNDFTGRIKNNMKRWK